MSVAVGQQKMFVDGAFVDALSGETMEVLNPATGETIAEVPKSGVEDVDRAVAAAEQAWETWRWKTPKDRMELLLKLADVMDENAEELARLESLNVGKPWWVAVDEPPVMSDNLRFFAGAARNLDELRRSVKNLIFIGIAPLTGAAILAYLFVKATIDLADVENSYSGQSVLGMGVPLAIALGFFLLGAVLLVAWRLAGNERFFGRRAFEAVEPGAGTGVSRT